MLPLFDALLAFAAFPLVLGVSNVEASQLAAATQTAAAFALVVGIASVLVVLCAALPVLWSLRERRGLTFMRVLLAGFALGNLPFAVYAAASLVFGVIHVVNGTLSQHLLPLADALQGTLRAAVLGSVFGVANACVFWLAGVRRALESADTATLR
jgi:hypothetical protein